MTNENNHPIQKRPHRRSYFGPILLIAIGLIFLAKNIGLIPAAGWGTIWRLWPVLLIVAGLDDLFRREGIAWPILMIGAGIFLLINYFGSQVQISWMQILQLWPILLIAAGIDILFKGQSSWMSLVGIALAFLLLGGAVWLTGQRIEVSANYQQFEEILPDGIEFLEYDFSLDVGELMIEDGAGKEVFISGNITPDDFIHEFDFQAVLARGEISNDGLDIFPHTARWVLDIHPDLPAGLRIQSGVGELLVQIDDLQLDSLWANQGLGRMVVELPGFSSDEVYIKQGVGEIQILLPEDARIVVDAQIGLSKVNFPAGFELEEGYYVSAGANENNADLLITVEQGIGLVNLRY